MSDEPQAAPAEEAWLRGVATAYDVPPGSTVRAPGYAMPDESEGDA